MKILKNIIGQNLAFFGIWVTADHGTRCYFEISLQRAACGAPFWAVGGMTKICASSESDDVRSVLTVVTQLYCRALLREVPRLGYLAHARVNAGGVDFDIVHMQSNLARDYVKNPASLVELLSSRGLLLDQVGENGSGSYVCMLDTEGPGSGIELTLIRRTYSADNPYFKLTEMAA